jgi:SecD/SecF fusion protein
MARGSSLRMTIHNGFDKALSAIVDSNITTLIAAVVLYMIGTDQIRGFAVTLFIGITMSMFSALYFGHLMFDIAERRRWVKELKMGKLIGVTSFDFIAKMKAAVTFSVTFILLGVVLLLARGTDSLDIDFSGGSMVTFQFKEPQQIDEVRTKLNKNNTFSTSMTLERLALSDEKTSADTGKQFRLRTKEQDVNKIRSGISETFPGDQLKHVTLNFTAPTSAGAKEVSLKETRNRKSDVALNQSSGQLPAAHGDDELKAGANKDDSQKEADKTEKPAASDKPAADKGDDEKKSASEKKDAENKHAKTKDTEKPDSDKKADAPSDSKAENDKPAGSKTKAEEEPKPAKTKPAEPKSPVKIPDEPELPETPADVAVDSFVGGQRSELTFSSEITTSTAGAYLFSELQKINTSFTDPEALFRVTGLEGSGTKAKEDSNVVRNYSKMLLETRNNVPVADLEKARAAMK